MSFDPQKDELIIPLRDTVKEKTQILNFRAPALRVLLCYKNNPSSFNLKVEDITRGTLKNPNVKLKKTCNLSSL